MAELRLSSAADSDIVEILARTHENFGSGARLRYEWLLVTALKDLAADPHRNGTIARVDLAPDVRSYHLRHSRDRARHVTGIVRRPRHLILFRELQPTLVGVGRILHDSMDLQRHLPSFIGED
ncbi:MAG: type II toxin-antitoxin system RelE/ParE family toxin [Pseudorhizobium pelagicum]|uniref:type II toxin-antitoxin system RelE/ParE family toxin n=1 Tax=Pseudorhizobium pelagicum TaxID=1509405 RepID=UPI0034615797